VFASRTENKGRHNSSFGTRRKLERGEIFLMRVGFLSWRTLTFGVATTLVDFAPKHYPYATKLLRQFGNYPLQLGDYDEAV
jgi:hypothetical protein